MATASSPATVTTTQPAFTIPARRFAFGGLTVLLIAAFLLSVSLGSVQIPLGDVAAVLLGGSASKESWTNIILIFRLPKAITATLAGAALAVAGLQMQTLFRNPLAGPFVLGISSGASLGVALVVLGTSGTAAVGLLAGLSMMGDFGIAAASTAGASLVLILVLLAARHVGNNMTLLILGLMFGYATSAVVSVLLHFSIAERIQAYLQWTFGSFDGVTWRQMWVVAPALLVSLATGVSAVKPLNALLLGETYAASMGVPVGRVRLLIIASASVLTGVVTAFCGPIAFLGVAVPHLCRSLFNTSDHRVLLPAVMLLGGTLALVADLIAHLPGSQITLPLNAVTALIGAPVVTWVILRQRNLRQAFAG